MHKIKYKYAESWSGTFKQEQAVPEGIIYTGKWKIQAREVHQPSFVRRCDTIHIHDYFYRRGARTTTGQVRPSAQSY